MGLLLPGSCVIPVLRSRAFVGDGSVSSRTQDVTIERECDGLDRTLVRA